jgi:hypothetical protein
VLDSNGQYIIEQRPERPEIRDHLGRVVQPARPTFSVPKVHKKPRMLEKTTTQKVPVNRPGRRTHWDFDAGKIKTAMDATGMDFGGYVKAEGGTQHLRHDQLIPVL